MSSLNRGCQIRWLGHAAFQITSPNGKVILIDPWLSNPKAPDGAMDSVANVDVLLTTHGHSDHLGESVAIGKKHQPEVPCMFELHLYFASQGLERTIPMNKGGTVTVADGIEVTMTSADHSTGFQEGEAGSPILYLGEAAGFVIRLENGLRIYHAGDTNVFKDMELIGDLYEPEIALLPIGGHFTMGPREAAVAARLLGSDYVIPMHYGTFDLLAGTPDELQEAIGDDGPTVLTMEPGETLT